MDVWTSSLARSASRHHGELATGSSSLKVGTGIWIEQQPARQYGLGHAGAEEGSDNEQAEKTLTAPKPGFTPLQKGLVEQTCACGGLAGIDGFCNECRDRKFTFPDAASVGLDHSQHTPLFMQSETHVVEQARLSDVSISSGPFFGHNFSRVQVHAAGPATIQTKQMIRQAADPYEQEADRVAEQVSSTASTPSGGDESTTEEPFMHKGVEQGVARPTQMKSELPVVHDVTRSPGQSLDAEIRIFMESRFGHDFSQVPIHKDAEAAAAARRLHADAFTNSGYLLCGRPLSTGHCTRAAVTCTRACSLGAAAPGIFCTTIRLVKPDEGEQLLERACLCPSLAQTAYRASSEHLLYPNIKKLPTGQQNPIESPDSNPCNPQKGSNHDTVTSRFFAYRDYAGECLYRRSLG